MTRGRRPATAMIAVAAALALLSFDAVAAGRSHAAAQSPATPARSPADETKDFAFPAADMMRIPKSNTYVAYGATSGGKRLPYKIVSYKGVTFKRSGGTDGDAFSDITFPKGYWAKPSSSIWVPAVFPHREEGKIIYYAFYPAQIRAASSTKRCIGYATSTSWKRGFRAAKNALFCPSGAGWAIDPDVTTGPNGAVWLTLRNGAWTRNRYTALGVSRLKFTARKVSLATQPKLLLRNDTIGWTHYMPPKADVITIENPHAVYLKNRWYLFYSGNRWKTNYYSTGVADCGSQLADGVCKPMYAKKAYFAFAPKRGEGFTEALPAANRKRQLPGNKRGPGAFEVFRDPDGKLWASWNYIRDNNKNRASRIAPLTMTGRGSSANFEVTWSR